MARTASVTRIFRFEAAHRLLEHGGECNRLHGHSYELWVTVSGPLGAGGMVMDFKDLKEAVQRAVVDVLDHRYLNDLFAFETTAENLAHWVWERLEEAGLRGLERVRLWETPNSFAEVGRRDREDGR